MAPPPTIPDRPPAIDVAAPARDLRRFWIATRSLALVGPVGFAAFTSVDAEASCAVWYEVPRLAVAFAARLRFFARPR